MLRTRIAPFRIMRRFSQVAATPSQPASLRYPYFISRNSLGSLPVYTDVRNGGTRYLVLIRNVDGDANVLAKHLLESLFKKDSPESLRMKIEIVRSKNLVITGGRWKNNITKWLKEKGF